MIASGRPHAVVTANVDFLVQAQRDVELRRILLEADLVLCDGTPLAWASRWLGNALPERVAGADLAPHLMALAAQKGYRVFFLGAAPGVAAEAEARLLRQFPTLKIVGTYAPPFQHLLEMDHAEIVRRVRAARPDIPARLVWLPEAGEMDRDAPPCARGVPAAIGVGVRQSTFSAGRVKRAPGWNAPLRGGVALPPVAQEPRRLLGRYATDFGVLRDRSSSGKLTTGRRGGGTWRRAREVNERRARLARRRCGTQAHPRAALETDPVFRADVAGPRHALRARFVERSAAYRRHRASLT